VDKQKEKDNQDAGKDEIPQMPSLKKKYSSVYAPKHIKHHEESLQQEYSSHRIRIDPSLHAGNDLLDELRFLDAPTCEIEKIPHLAAILEDSEFHDIVSPLFSTSSQYRSIFGGEGFLPAESFVSKNSYVISNPMFGPTYSTSDLKRYLRAGPRKQLYFDPAEVKACIVTCGGLCPGLNVVIREVYNCLSANYGIKEVYGITYGYKGFYTYDWRQLTAEDVQPIHHQGGTMLGSSRGGFNLEKILDAITERGINQIYCIGGDGTHKGMYELFKEISKRKLKISICGVPKTIDNDIPIIDKSFGFETAVMEATRAIESANVEANSAEYGVGLVKLMGRSAGFIAMYASLANRDVNICLVPEFKFELGGPRGLLRYIVRRLKAKKHCVIVVAEGASSAILDYDLCAVGTDASGNPKLPDVGSFLRDKIVDFCGKQGIDVTLKYIDPTYMIRTVPANAFDQQICSQLAQNGVHGVMSGWTGFTVGNLHDRGCYIPIVDIINKKRQIELHNRPWQRLMASTGQPSFINDEDDIAEQVNPGK